MNDLAWLQLDRLSILDAVAAIEAALDAGLDPEATPTRGVLDNGRGQLLFMPATDVRHLGVKLVTIFRENSQLPRIHGIYVLFDAVNGRPVAIADGAALTALRTPAVSAAAIRLITPERPLTVVLFGTGPQALGHAKAVAAVRPGTRLTVVGRDQAKSRAFAGRCAAAGLTAVAGRADAIAGADLVVCCTSSATPLFDGDLVPGHAAVVAIGSHQSHARELDAGLVSRATLYADSRTTALREAGELAGVESSRVRNLAELRREPVDLTRPRVFKSVGVAWQDLVVAAAALRILR